MSSTSSPKSHTSWWWLSAVLLLPLLYVLSVPALLRCAGVRAHPQELKYWKKAPPWIKNYCAPYNWALSSSTPLQKPLDAYVNVWGYKRSKVIVQAEETMRRAQETLRKSKERLVELKESREQREKRMEELRQRYLKLRPPPAQAPKPPANYESLLRKSS